MPGKLLYFVTMTFDEYAVQLKIAPAGKKLQYWEGGNGPVLMLLHGALANGFTFRKMLADLTRSFRCIALHLPLGGHHIPLGRDADLSPKGIAELMTAFMEFTGIKEAHFLANDTGGAYAQVFATAYPEKVLSLILSNCEVDNVFPPPRLVYLRYAVRVPGFTFLMAKLFSVKSWLKHPLVMGALSLAVTCDELAEGYIGSFVDNKRIRKDFANACRQWHPRYTVAAARQLRYFKKTVLVLWGEKDDLLFPRTQMEKLLQIFPHAKWQSILNSKTCIQEDGPRQAVQAILHFLAQP